MNWICPGNRRPRARGVPSCWHACPWNGFWMCTTQIAACVIMFHAKCQTFSNSDLGNVCHLQIIEMQVSRPASSMLFLLLQYPTKEASFKQRFLIMKFSTSLSTSYFLFIYISSHHRQLSAAPVQHLQKVRLWRALLEVEGFAAVMARLPAGPTHNATACHGGHWVMHHR